ncbi:MAG: hypothetical protein PF541_13925 [Prolixibacteraceae bacterium]|jgi:hypothetical protein|nr:hypothetical protein [Prolixibacteraceae bacterium]
MKKAYILVVAVSILAACSSNKVPKDAKIVAAVKTELKATGNYSLANFTLQIPNSWEEEAASNSMRVAQFKVKEFPEYEVVVSYFGNNNNMVKANIERWKGQFSQQESYTELSPNQNEVTGVKIIGTYKLKAFPMAQDFSETPNYGTLAAIVPSNEGPYFLKLTAPAHVIESQEKYFVEVLNSYSIK